MNFDQTLIALCEKHDLNTISVNVSRSAHHDSGFYAYANAHWENSGNRCSSGHGDNAVEAIANAIIDANVKRAASVEVPTLELDEAA